MNSETLALLVILASFIACCASLIVGYRIGYERGHMKGWSEAKQDDPYAFYVGKRVTIEWISEDSDWPEFTVLACAAGKITLRGESFDGSKHDGVPFTCSIGEIKTIALSSKP